MSATPLRALPALALTLLALGGAIPPGAAQQVPCQLSPLLCPDLVVDPLKFDPFVETRTFPPSSCDVQEGHVPAGTHRLLRFTFTTPNLGPGVLHVGPPSQHPEWFVWAPCHRHWHFREYADYRLWTEEAYPRWLEARAANPLATAAEVLASDPALRAGFVAGHKQGFCVIDLVNYVPGAPAAYRSCGHQGISVGWADEYFWSIGGQWIVVDGVPPGTYWLEAEVNAERLYEETLYANNFDAERVILS